MFARDYLHTEELRCLYDCMLGALMARETFIQLPAAPKQINHAISAVLADHPVSTQNGA